MEKGQKKCDKCAVEVDPEKRECRWRSPCVWGRLSRAGKWRAKWAPSTRTEGKILLTVRSNGPDALEKWGRTE